MKTPMTRACRRLCKRWRIQATQRERMTWEIPPDPGPLIATWLRECAAELEHEAEAVENFQPVELRNMSVKNPKIPVDKSKGAGV